MGGYEVVKCLFIVSEFNDGFAVKKFFIQTSVLEKKFQKF